MAVDIDSVLVALGEVGPYQMKIYFLLCLPIIFVGAANLAYVFIAAKPDYRCFIENCDDEEKPEYHEQFLNYTIPLNNKTNKYDSCHHYVKKSNDSFSTCFKDDFSENVTTCEYGYVFDKSIYESTIVSEFNLTCGDSWEASADQSVYFGGMLVGSIFFGYFSDKYGRRKIILAGIACMAISGITIALVPNLLAFQCFEIYKCNGLCWAFSDSFHI
ncbi:Organic cation transporter protein, partial [Armadillidium nasatum]